MVETVGSGDGADEAISETGISHSEVPTLCGPKGSGRYGMGFRYEIIFRCLLCVVSGLVMKQRRVEAVECVVARIRIYFYTKEGYEISLRMSKRVEQNSG